MPMPQHSPARVVLWCARHAEAALAGQELRADQRAAFDHATGAGGLQLIEGRAGTGKSHALGVVRDAHEGAGHRVVGLAPTNAVAQDLKAAGFDEASTVHAALFALKNGRSTWDRHTVVIVDEAAMLDGSPANCSRPRAARAAS